MQVQQDLAGRDLTARNRAAADLAAHVAGVRIDYDDVLDTPQYIGSPLRLLTDKPADRPLDAKRIVAGFVRDHADIVGIVPDELSAAVMERDFFTQHNGVRHFTYQQQIDGIDIFQAFVRTSVTPAGEIVNFSSLMLPRPAGGFVVPDWRLSATEAVERAAANVGITLMQPRQLKQPAAGPQQRQVFARTADFADDVEVWKVYFPLTAKQVRPGWLVVVPQPGIGNVYEIIVDAADGRILHRWNRLHFDTTEPIMFNIYTSDSPGPGSPGTDTPNGFQFPLVPRTLVTVTPADVMTYSPNGWINDGVNETLGNNVDAHTDLDANNSPDLPRPMGNPYRVFDFPQDNAMPPSSYRSAAVTQLFYLTNLHHDKLYSLGFDEAAHNFQDMNFSGMGVGGDRIQADAQDGSGTNNANFSTTGTDGSTGRVQMYVWTGPNPDRDGDLDADIVFHELTHGVSIRLNDGTLVAPQGGGMGEGWSDFFAVVLNSQTGDDVNGVYPAGAYSTLLLGAGFVNNYYFGIRRFPYSTDLNKNPETFADIDPNQLSFPPSIPRSPVIGNNAAEVHNVGEVWCTTLLECRANVVTHYGFSGNDLVLQLVVDGMKLNPLTPNFLQSRDAILQADMVDNNGANLLPSLWPGFAKRGMGYSATSPGAGSTSGIVEAFDTPAPTLQFTYPLGRPDISAPTGGTPVTVEVTGLFDGVLAPGSVQLHAAIDDGPFSAVPMTPTDVPNRFVAPLPPAPCFSRLQWYITGEEVTNGLVSNPASAPAASYEAVSATGTSIPFQDDFETNLGWTVGAPGDTATTGIWVRVDPVGTAAQPEDDHTPNGTMCYVTGQQPPGGTLGSNDVDGGGTTLLSPTLDLSSIAGPIRIRYARWYSNSTGSSPNADTFVISISNNNGATWTIVETVGPVVQASGGWFEHEFVVNDFVTPTAQVKMRFVASDFGAGSIVEAAVDDFAVITYTCAINGNCNGQGGIGLLDYALFGACLTGPDVGSIGPQCSCADLDADLDVDLQDVADFQNLFSGE
ncbi:MAG TPA: M36 family metallopeptidase [Phycisphaerae bacterium]